MLLAPKTLIATVEEAATCATLASAPRKIAAKRNEDILLYIFWWYYKVDKYYTGYCKVITLGNTDYTVFQHE
jgi:hypothetical protein